MVMGVGKNDLTFVIAGNDKSGKAIKGFKKNVGGANSALAQLRNTIIAAFSVREIVEAANVMIGVENRMNALTQSAEKTGIAMDHMRRIALDSRSDFDAVAMLYTRLALATDHLGATQRDVADATQTVANTFIIAGSHAQEANNSARQLAQGLASGALRGDELRSVMENNTILTKMLADGLNMTIGELREFGHAGKLTAETVMPILIEGMKSTNEQVTKMPMTLGQAGVALRNNFQFIIGDVEKASKGFSGLASVVNKFAQNIDGLLIPAIALAAVAIFTHLIPAIIALNKAVYANPWTAFATGVILALTAMYMFRDEIVFIFKTITKKEFPILVNEFKITAIQAFEKFHDLLILPLKKGFVGLFNFLFTTLNISINNINAVLDKLPKRIKDKLGIKNIPPIELIPDPVSQKSKNDGRIAAITADIAKTAAIEIKKTKIPSFMDMLLGRDPNAKPGDDGTGFKMLSPLEKFLKDAENGFKKFYTNIKTMQDELQGVFQKSYDGLTDITMKFLETGKASFKDYATSIVRELMRIAIQKLLIDRMFAGIGGTISSIRDNVQGQIDWANITGGGDPFIFAGGGYTGNGARAGGVDGKGGFPAILHPQETIIDHARGQSSGATINFNISTVDAVGFDELLASRKGLITSIINNAMNNRGRMGVT